MKHWEYKSIYTELKYGPEPDFPKLNELGKDGWELVTSCFEPFNPRINKPVVTCHHFLKREIGA